MEVYWHELQVVSSLTSSKRTKLALQKPSIQAWTNQDEPGKLVFEVHMF